MLKLNNMKSQPGATHKIKRVGRGQGSGWGQTAGRGVKGQSARAGGQSDPRPGFEGGQTPLYRRLPKQGFINIHRIPRAIMNVRDLEFIDNGEMKEITLETLQKARKVHSSAQRLSILGDGELTKAFTVKAHKITKTAEEKIKKAGGTVEILPEPPKFVRADKKAEKKKAAKSSSKENQSE